MSRRIIALFVAASGTVVAPFVASAQPHQHTSPAAPTAQPQGPITPRPSDPYPLTTCPVSGGELGSMGEPIVKEYDGQEVRFCCAPCVPKFEAAQARYTEQIAQKIIEHQIPFYPLTTCLVTGEPLPETAQDVVNVVRGNRLVRFCCSACVAEFEKDPETLLARLDAAVVQQQRDHYPLDTCLVSGEKLGDMGEAVEVLIGNRLVRLCCAGCEADLRARPLEFLPALDDAWTQQGLPEPTHHLPELESIEHAAPGHPHH
jgi:YHS domain-containing protein